MGAGIVMKMVDEDGQTKYVRLSGTQKAAVYEMLARFGVYESEPHEGARLGTGQSGASNPEVEHQREEFKHSKKEPQDEEVKRFEPRQIERLGLDERLELLKKVDVSTMHCCEAAEILFEDIS
jgi:hypothetical protein